MVAHERANHVKYIPSYCAAHNRQVLAVVLFAKNVIERRDEERLDRVRLAVVEFLLLDEFDAELDIDLWCLIHLLEVDKVVKACAFLRKLELRLLLLESAFDEVVKNEVRVFQEGRAAATHHREDVDAREGGLETFPG